MKVIRGIKIGGLQQKVFNLMLIFIILLIGAYAAVSVYQQRALADIVQQTSNEQQASIADASEETMRSVLGSSMTQSTALQAYIANDLFDDVKTNVLTLQAFAEELFEHAEQFSPHPFYLPDPANDGVPSAQMQHEEGIEPAASADLGLLANMSEVMLAMFESSDKLSSCFAATTDGCILFVDDRAGMYISETGEVFETFPVRERPWYRQAAEAGELIFTGVEPDTYSGIPGLVCAAPVYRDGELVAVVGADIFLTSISDYVESKASEGSFLCVLNENGQILFSPEKEGVFKVELSENAPDLRISENKALAAFVGKALQENTGLELVEIDGKAFYMCGVPMKSLGWAVLSVVDREITHQPTELMLSRYDRINQEALALYRQGARRSAQTVIVLTLVILALAVGGALVVAGRVVKPLEIMTRRINALDGSDQAFEMEDAYRTDDEIEILAESFASLSKRTREYIAENSRITAEKERISTELALANQIQAAMLPHVFPPFPERPEFDVYASMLPAKEVGGDFYDFYFIDDDNYALETETALTVNIGIPIHLFSTHWLEWFNIENTDSGVGKLLNFLGFELHLSPFLDIGILKNRATNEYFSIKNGLYAGGFELILYPEKWKSYAIRASLGFDLSKNKKWRSPTKDYELFIGVGHLF